MSPIQQSFVDVAGESAPPPIAAPESLQTHPGHASGWVVYTRDHSRLPWPVAFRDSLAAFAAKTGYAATTARLHPADLATLGALATEAGLVVLTGGGVQVDAETWGLA